MTPDTMTVKLAEGMADAAEMARRQGHAEITPWHVISVLLRQEDGLLRGVLDRLEVDSTALQGACDAELRKRPARSGGGATGSVGGAAGGAGAGAGGRGTPWGGGGGAPFVGAGAGVVGVGAVVR